MIAWSAIGISGTLHRMEKHNRKFLPEEPSPQGWNPLKRGDVLRVRAFGVEQVGTVEDVLANDDGSQTVNVLPLGMRVD